LIILFALILTILFIFLTYYFTRKNKKIK
jgi:hypothetical protein